MNKSNNSQIININSESISSLLITNKDINTIKPNEQKLEDKSKTEACNNNNNPATQNDDEKDEIIGKLQEICKKYKTVFEPDDLADFENIIQTLKTNLSDD